MVGISLIAGNFQRNETFKNVIAIPFPAVSCFSKQIPMFHFLVGPEIVWLFHYLFFIDHILCIVSSKYRQCQ
jgi:hypothetical protein